VGSIGGESEDELSSLGAGFLIDLENPRVYSTTSDIVLVATEEAAATAPRMGSDGPSSIYQSRCRTLQSLAKIHGGAMKDVHFQVVYVYQLLIKKNGRCQSAETNIGLLYPPHSHSFRTN
jgi:hypothetical protein